MNALSCMHCLEKMVQIVATNVQINLIELHQELRHS